jgi:farnesyl-diphosphate farnesyltransferase
LLRRFEEVFEGKKLPIQVHSEGFSSFLFHPDEAYFAVAFRLGMFTNNTIPLDTEDYRFCESVLKKVSRSFALVIQTLPSDLRIAICIFYLVLRGLDTIEDDMTSFKDNKSMKIKLLKGFASKFTKKSYQLKNVGEDDERILLEEFDKVLRVFQTLSKEDQGILQDICQQMGDGMAEFLKKDIRLGTASLDEYNLYCHYVAGLVGEGLTKLFVAHGKEDKTLLNFMKEADEMGKFLQKTNIIRDYLEDLHEGRTFWPRDIWTSYAPSLLDLRTGDKAKSLECLNEMIVDAYRHVPAVLRYLSQIKNPQVFKFCAIPQVMAIATLERLVNNPDVFTGVVKIRKGLMLSLFQYTGSIEEVKGIFSAYSEAILSNLPAEQSAHKKIIPIIYEVEGLCIDGIQPAKPWPSLVSLLLSFSVLLYTYLQNGRRQWLDFILLLTMFLFMTIKKLVSLYSKMFSKGSS